MTRRNKLIARRRVTEAVAMLACAALLVGFGNSLAASVLSPAKSFAGLVGGPTGPTRGVEGEIVSNPRTVPDSVTAAGPATQFTIKCSKRKLRRTGCLKKK